MSYWIFTVTGHKLDEESYSPEDILKQRFEDRFWGLGEKTPNRRSLQKGDCIVFYMGLPHKVFAAEAKLAPTATNYLKKNKTRYRTEPGSIVLCMEFISLIFRIGPSVGRSRTSFRP